MRGQAATLCAERPAGVRTDHGGIDIRHASLRRARNPLRELASVLAVASGSALVLGIAAEAQTPSDGAEFQVNTTTSSFQKRPTVAAGPGGMFAIVWTSSESAGGDTSATSIQSRWIPSGGASPGDETQVNLYTPGLQFTPNVAFDGAGRAIITWASIRSPTTGYDINIRARRFAADGSPVGEPFQVSTDLGLTEMSPISAGDASGNFIVVWYDCICPGGGDLLPRDRHELDGKIRARRYDSKATPLGDPFQLNAYTTGEQGHGAVAMTPEGDFIVAWWSRPYFGDDSSIQVRRFASNGAPKGVEFQLNTYATDSQRLPVAARDTTGNFVVVWESFSYDPLNVNRADIRARRLDADGFPLGDEFLVNTITTGAQQYPAVAADGEGGFLVVWQSFGSSGSDTSGFSIQGRRYGPDGLPLGGEFQVNTYTTGNQTAPGVAVDDAGNFLVVWECDASDGDAEGIRARLFRPVFLDGFESGGTDRWSAATPPWRGRIR